MPEPQKAPLKPPYYVLHRKNFGALVPGEPDPRNPRAIRARRHLWIEKGTRLHPTEDKALIEMISKSDRRLVLIEDEKTEKAYPALVATEEKAEADAAAKAAASK